MRFLLFSDPRTVKTANSKTANNEGRPPVLICKINFSISIIFSYLSDLNDQLSQIVTQDIDVVAGLPHFEDIDVVSYQEVEKQVRSGSLIHTSISLLRPTLFYKERSRLADNGTLIYLKMSPYNLKSGICQFKVAVTLNLTSLKLFFLAIYS